MDITKLHLKGADVARIWGRAPLPPGLSVAAWFENARGARFLFLLGPDRICAGRRGRLLPFDDPVAAAVRLYRARLSAVGGRAKSPAKTAGAKKALAARWAKKKKGDKE